MKYSGLLYGEAYRLRVLHTLHLGAIAGNDAVLLLLGEFETQNFII